MSSKPRLWPFVVAAFLLVMINLPLAHMTWNNHRLDTHGIEGVGQVSATKQIGEKRFVTFHLDDGAGAGGAEEKTYTVEVTPEAFQRAERDETIAIVYLPDDPGTNRALAQVPTGSLPWWLTGMANLAVLVMVVLMLWSRRHAMLVLEATEDVTRCKPDDTVLELGGELFLVRGDILEIHDDYIVLQANSDQVKVILGEHHNPVGHQQPAQVRGRKVSR
ncbi:hypothetical protein [Nocardioides sp. AE5]|uniref:hypothetical protein n=1 Tax=Nocardioides sp. AE5 TaxID=2962573 RepID=UPI0028819B52|nr:hypothetical protein [Nocardioides sp. AE5]MDT0202376.1 hypothetical protein [Nocardioides sp. AE5]